MIQDVLVYVAGALVASAVVAAILYWRFAWSRDRRRFVIAATATFIGWVLWRTVLQLSNADNLDVDNPWLLGLSAQDVGSGVLAFVLTALPLGLLWERNEPARRIVACAGIAGALAMLVDRFI